MDDPSALLAGWPVEQAAGGVTGAGVAEGGVTGGGVTGGGQEIWGDPAWRTRIASLTKLLVGYAALVAVEEGAITLDEPAGPPGATVRQLLCHASGLAFDQDRLLAPPGARRIYSNVGIDRFAEHLADRTGIAFADYLNQAVLAPLAMRDTSLAGSAAHGGVSTVADLLRFARELLRPELVSAATLAEATRVQYPELSGVLPGIGRFDPNPWGLTFELRAGKDPHWTGRRNTPATFGHFGGSGGFLWVDPVNGLGCVALTDRAFGQWALAAWPPFSDAVLGCWGRAGEDDGDRQGR